MSSPSMIFSPGLRVMMSTVSPWRASASLSCLSSPPPAGGGSSQRVLGDEREQLGVRVELGSQRLLHPPVDLTDAALGDAEDLAYLGQRQVLDVEHHGDLALTLVELR